MSVNRTASGKNLAAVNLGKRRWRGMNAAARTAFAREMAQRRWGKPKTKARATKQ